MPASVPRQRDTPPAESGQARPPATYAAAPPLPGGTAPSATAPAAFGTAPSGAVPPAPAPAGAGPFGTAPSVGANPLDADSLGTDPFGTPQPAPAGFGTDPFGTPQPAPAGFGTAMPAPAGFGTAAPASGVPLGATSPSAGPQAMTLLVIQDDPGGLTVPEIVDAEGHRIRIRTARNLTEAQRLLTPDVHCILLDLCLPGSGNGSGSGSGSGSGNGNGSSGGSHGGPAATGPAVDELATLRQVLRMAPRHAVLVLTAEADAERAAEAVRVGAQDYLYGSELDGRLLSRAIRYAVERKRADIAQYKLAESRLRAQENARLERGLLPHPLLEGSDLRFAARYHAGRSRALLGGDFYDTVRTPDGTVHAMIGDVCGHGPDEAALGVELRIAWRALTLAGLCGDDLLATLQEVLEVERPNEEIFATLCTVDISPDGRRAGLCLAGHPAPLISWPGRPARLLPYEDSGPALGLLPRARWPRRQVELGGTWSLMLYTDGLIEGRIGAGRERLGQDGMVEMINRHLDRGLRGEGLLEAAVSEARRLNGGELTDDVAVVLLDRASG